MKRLRGFMAALMVALSLCVCTASADTANPLPAVSADGAAFTETTSESDDFSAPGYAAKADGYTFFTDLRNVYSVNHQTGEVTTLFASKADILCILEYADLLYVQFNNRIVSMDYAGNEIDVLKRISMLFCADGYIYYTDGLDIWRKPVSGENAEFISDWFDETNGVDDMGYWSDYIGYYDGKVYFQDNQKIYTLTGNGVKAYCCDGGYHSMKDSILIVKRDDGFYSRDVETGNEFKVYSFENLEDHNQNIAGEYIGSYEECEYYLMDGKILETVAEGDTLIHQAELPFEYVEYATVSSEWIYIYSIAETPEFIRYNILAGQKEAISALPYLTPIKTIIECDNRIYYIDSNESGLFMVDLIDNSFKQIYSGTMYVLHIYL